MNLCTVLTMLCVLVGMFQDNECAASSSLLDRVSGKLVFQSDRDGDWEIYVMNADGSHLGQLTFNNAADEYPVWSPDGKQIAFTSNRDGTYQIYVMDADGQNQRQLTTHASNNEDPAWSPDGKKIAFHSDRESNQEIYIMNADGSGLEEFTRTIGRNILPAWSPDGKQMAYTGNRYLGWNVYVTTLDKEDDKRITGGHGACRPDWSPDGKQIAYVSQEADGKGDIWLMNPDGSGKKRVTFDDKNYDYYPAWSPDGKYIVYANTPDKERGNWELYLLTSDGQEHTRLTNHPARDKFPDWAVGNISENMFKQQEMVFEAERSPHQVGSAQAEPDASGERAAFAEKNGQPGFLVYGPYQSLAPGEYIATFRLKIEQNTEKKTVLFFDVAADAGQLVLAKKELQGKDVEQAMSYQAFQLPFSLQETKNVEFRVFVFGLTNVWVDRVTVQRN